jgi:hypothetical protein
VRLLLIEEDREVLLLFVDLPHHELEEGLVVRNVVFLLEIVSLRDKALLVDLYEKVDQVLILFESLQQALEQQEDRLQQRRAVLELLHLLAQQLHQPLLHEETSMNRSLPCVGLLVYVGP